MVKPPRRTAGQPVAGEARDDPPADHADERDDQSDARARGVFRQPGKMRLEMESDVDGRQERYDADHLQIIPLAAGDDFARRGGYEQQQEDRIQSKPYLPSEPSGKGRCRPARDPRPEQQSERPSLDRQAPCPIGNSREEKTGDDGADVAKQHLMDMPIPRSKRGRQVEAARKDCKPQWNHRPGVDRAEEKEWPKPL
jgi:hypothetical protein